MANGSKRKKSRAILDFVKWFQDTHASDVQVVNIAVALLTGMRAISRKSVCELFDRAFAEPYGEAIRVRDEAFFLTAPVPTAAPSAMAGVTSGVHVAWDRMTPAAKDETWTRLGNLMALDS